MSSGLKTVFHIHTAAAAAAKSLQSCPTLCDPIDGSPPGSPVPGILQARTLDWVAISFSNASKWKGKMLIYDMSCFCLIWPSLENPRDGGAWWAAVSGVAQSRTRLKRLSSILYCTSPPNMIQSSSVQLLSCVQLFATPWTAAC